MGEYHVVLEEGRLEMKQRRAKGAGINRVGGRMIQIPWLSSDSKAAQPVRIEL